MPTPEPSLAPGDYVFMAFLGCGPMSAYDVKKAMAGSVNFFWTAAHSQVYQQARRLVRDGFVEESPGDNARRRRILSLTPAGRKAVAAWLAGPAPLVRSYDESIAKLFFGDQGDPADLAAMLEDQRAQHAALLASFEGMAAGLGAWDWGTMPPYPVLTLRLGVRVERAWVEWLDETIAVLKGEATTGTPPAAPAP